MFRRLIPAALAALALAAPAAPATPAPPTAPAQVDDLSVERLYGTQDFTPDQVSVRWIDGAHYTVLEDDAAGRTDLYRVEARSGVRELLVRGAELSAPGGDPVRDLLNGFRRRISGLSRAEIRTRTECTANARQCDYPNLGV